jgi:inhibitor of KinA
VEIVPWGDSAVTVEFEERIDPAVNASVIALARLLEAVPVPGVRDVVPTFRSLTVYFDPLKIDRSALLGRLEQDAGVAAAVAPKPYRLLRIPVCYGGEFGPDLGLVARFGEMNESDAIALHSGTSYRVFMLGFIPGFAYMASVDARIAVPRRPSPRVRVPGGSVAIAGTQTGVYPSESPGGWHLIGRTPARPFDLERSAPFLFEAGDSVRFYPVTAAEYDAAPVTIKDLG